MLHKQHEDVSSCLTLFCVNMFGVHIISQPPLALIRYLTHSLTSVYNANTFHFKCHLQSHLKFIKSIIKIIFSAYLLQRISAS
jgi:hypothetical protein